VHHDLQDATRSEAALEAEIALRLSPAPAEGHEALATYALLRNDPTTAIAEFERALEAAPNSAPLRLALGNCAASRGDADLRSRHRTRSRVTHHQSDQGQADLRCKGTAGTLAALLEQVSPGWDPCGLATFFHYTAYSVQRSP
jgi:tetratricopeptide (TPR) repeat protein